MKKIESFQVNHDVLEPGMYVSRIDMGDIVTYDLRYKKPNVDDFLDVRAMHTTEHLFATFCRSSKISDRVIYFGPMGCLTGYYLILKGVSHEDAMELVKQGAKFISEYEGEIPGNTSVECGNYLSHDMETAKSDCAKYYAAIKDITVQDLEYKS